MTDRAKNVVTYLLLTVVIMLVVPLIAMIPYTMIVAISPNGIFQYVFIVLVCLAILVWESYVTYKRDCVLVWGIICVLLLVLHFVCNNIVFADSQMLLTMFLAPIFVATHIVSVICGFGSFFILLFLKYRRKNKTNI